MSVFNKGETFTKGSRYIQWKGTSACMDQICLCGVSTHFDVDCAYFFHCKACDRVFLNPSVQALIELTGADREEALGTPSVMELEND